MSVGIYGKIASIALTGEGKESYLLNISHSEVITVSKVRLVDEEAIR